MAASKNPGEDDPVLAAEMERALKPYVGMVPPAYLEVLRDILRHALTENAVGKTLLDRVRALEQKPPKQSGSKTKGGAPAEPKAGIPSSGKPGRR